MNKKLMMLMAAALALLSASGQVRFTNYGDYPPYVIHLTDNHTSLNKVFVVFNTDEVEMTYTAQSNNPVIWKTYDSQDWSDPKMIPVTHNGRVTTLENVKPNKGYIIEDGDSIHYYWVVNYADYYLQLNSLTFDYESPCSLLTLHVDGQGDAIPYYEINGTPKVLDRDIKLKYDTRVWDDSTHWTDDVVTESFDALERNIEMAPPLWNTVFHLSGDRFLEEWNLVKSIKSDQFVTRAVGCGTTAEQDPQSDNEISLSTGGLGGSAPVHIVFTGYPTEAVISSMWEMGTDPDFENVIDRVYNQEEVEYTFTDWGNYYVRYVVTNDDGTCEASNDYTINVSESELRCPNAFSPLNHDGANDIWKVSYKSIAEFHCWIYNRWGNLVYEYTDPGGGWDGTYRGKLVDTGVYYYVVRAVGTDGKVWNPRGAISILRFKRGGSEPDQNATN